MYLAPQRDPGGAYVIVAMDLFGLPEAESGKVRALAERATGVPRDHIILAASHTDSGPATVGVLKLVDAASPGQILALAFNHAGHPRVLSGDNYLISADYPGAAARASPTASVRLRREEGRQREIEQICVVGLANGAVGFVPTRRAIGEGGYAVDTRCLDEGAEEIVVERSLSLLRQVYARARPS